MLICIKRIMNQPTPFYDERHKPIVVKNFLLSPLRRLYFVLIDDQMGISIEHIYSKTREKLTQDVANQMNIIHI